MDSNNELPHHYHTSENSTSKTLTPWEMLQSGLQTILFFSSAVTNCFVLLVIYRHKQTLKGSNLFVLNLVLAGTLTTFTVMPTILLSTYTHGCLGSSVTCFVQGSLVTMLTSCISMTIVCITLDRYFALCYPLAYKSKATTKKTQLVTLLIWIVSLLITLIPITSMSKVAFLSGIGFCFPKDQQLTSTVEKIYLILVVLLMYVIPSCMLTYTNSLIFIKTRAATANRRMYSGVHISHKEMMAGKKTLIEMHRFESSTRNKGSHMLHKEHSKLLEQKKTSIMVHKDNRKAAWMLFISIVSFICCNGPFAILLILYMIPGAGNTLLWLEFIAVICLFLNPIINPFIYVFRNVYVKNLIVSSIPNMETSERNRHIKGKQYKTKNMADRLDRFESKKQKYSIEDSSSDPPSMNQRQETMIVFHTVTKGVITVL